MIKIHSRLKEFLLAAAFFLFLTLILFWPTFTQSLVLFPENYLQAWFEPWRTDHWQGMITLPHKPVGEDIFRLLYPNKNLAMKIIQSGQLPLWNPYGGAGTPLLATMQEGLLNFFNLLFLFLPPIIAWNFLLLIQPLILGLSFYLYARHLKISFTASIFGSLTLITSGFVIVRLIYDNFLYIFACLPLFLLFIDKIFAGKFWPALIIPLLLFLIFCFGHPQMASYVLVATLVYIFFKIIFQQKDQQRTRRQILILLSSSLLGVGLSAIQLLPTIELWRSSALNQENSAFLFNQFLSPLKHFVTLFVPNFFGNPATYNYWGYADYLETVLYIGCPALIFAIYGLFSNLKKGKNSPFSFYILLLLLTIFFTICSPLSQLLVYLPLLSNFVPSRLFSLTTFSLSIFASFGFESWLKFSQKINPNFKKTTLVFLSAWTLIFLFLFFSVRHQPDCPQNISNCYQVSLRNTLFSFSIFVVTFGLFFLGFLHPRHKKHLSYLIISVVFLSNLYLAKKFLPFSQASFYPENEITQVLKKMSINQLYRFWSVGEGKIKTNLMIPLMVLSPEYYGPLSNRRYAEFISFINHGDLTHLQRSAVEIDDEINDQAKNQRREKGLDFISVKYVLSKEKSSVYPNDELNQKKKTFFCHRQIWQNENWSLCERSAALPRFFLAGQYQVINQENILSKMFQPEFRPQETVILEKNLNYRQNPSPADGKIQLLVDRGQSLELEVQTSTPQVLVITDNFFPGWQANLDGQKTEIYRANYTFKALFVPQGLHRVKLIYQPQSFLIGAIISGISLLLLFILSIFYLLVQKKIKP